jgi:hypothetical protein
MPTAGYLSDRVGNVAGVKATPPKKDDFGLVARTLDIFSGYPAAVDLRLQTMIRSNSRR